MVDLAFHIPLFEQELMMDSDFKDIGRAAITATGSTPGITNVLASIAAEKFDDIELIKIIGVDVTESDVYFTTWSSEFLLGIVLKNH